MVLPAHQNNESNFWFILVHIPGPTGPFPSVKIRKNKENGQIASVVYNLRGMGEREEGRTRKEGAVRRREDKCSGGLSTELAP